MTILQYITHSNTQLKQHLYSTLQDKFACLHNPTPHPRAPKSAKCIANQAIS